ncbi:MAG: MEDS domain-containing protein [Candidatus Thorarchaeota archaeon]
MERILISELEAGSKILTEFGLTPYQSMVYLAIVKLGLTTASRVSKLTGVRREEVYRTLPKLEEAGLVERVLGRPVKVRALSVEDALSILIKKKKEAAEKEISDLTSKKDELLGSLNDFVSPAELDEDQAHFVLTSDKDSVIVRTLSAVSNAKREIDIVDSSHNILRFILTYTEPLANMQTKGVVVRILSDCPDDPVFIPSTLEEHFPGNEILLRYSEDVSAGYILIDQKEAIITTSIGGVKSDSRRLWTDDSSLVSILYRDFDEQFHSSTEWQSYTKSSELKMARILKDLKPREHVILVYNTLEAKRDTLFSYIQGALENGEAARYVCSEESTDSIRKAMIEYGIDVQANEATGALGILDYTDIYIKDGTFSIDDVMDTWTDLYNKIIDDGFSGMRVTGEMNCFLEHQLLDELIEYEQALHTVLDIPMIAICAYNAQKLQEINNPINIYYELVKAHGRTLYVDRDNQIGEIEIRA